MAFFSTWDWNKNAWRIYRSPETVSVGDDPTPPRPTGLNVLGADPDTGVRALPSNAAFVGYDHMARGEIRRAIGVGGLGDAIADTDLKRDAGFFLLGVAAAMVFAKYYGEQR